MIIKGFINIVLGLLRVLFSAFQLVDLPFSLISVLASILAYGVWVVGADVMAIFVTSVTFWWGVNWSVKIFEWIWNKLPFT